MPEDKKQKILLAAYTEFAQQGKAGARMQMISERANANQAMLNYYFTSKDNLYLTVVRHVIDEIQSSILNTPFDDSLSVRENYRCQIDLQMQYWADHPEALRLLTYDILEGGEGIKKLFQNLIESQDFVLLKKKLDKDSTARIKDLKQIQLFFSLLTMCTFLCSPTFSVLWPEQNAHVVLKNQMEAMKDLFEHGVFTEPPANQPVIPKTQTMLDFGD